MIENQAIIKNPPFPGNYAPTFLVIDSGEGVWVKDIKGKSYLDFGAGIAVNALGYGRKDLAEIGAAQMKKLIHISNLYTTKPALDLAQKLTEGTDFQAVHFGNSGTEAIEAAIKYSRLYTFKKKGAGHHKLLCFKNAFHGRTLGALSCTPTPKYQEPFMPLIPGVVTLEFNNVEQLKSTLDESFAGVLVEVVQGEGGLTCMTKEFAQALNELCTEKDVILTCDEIQTGLTRTGTLYACQGVGLKPDIITLSKPLAGGLPLSATLIPEKINKLLKVGEHGTTFGGGPVTTAIALKVWEILSDKAFIAQAKEKGLYLKKLLEDLSASKSYLGAIKGKGLLMGIEVNKPSDEIGGIIDKARDEGLLILRSGVNVLRLAPPLVISREELKQGVEILEKIL